MVARAVVENRINSGPAKHSLNDNALLDAHRPPRQPPGGRFDGPQAVRWRHRIAAEGNTAEAYRDAKGQQGDRCRGARQQTGRAQEKSRPLAVKGSQSLHWSGSRRSHRGSNNNVLVRFVRPLGQRKTMSGLEQSWAAEFELAVQCCKAAFRDAAPDPPAVPAGLNWQRFSRFTAFHRIEGFAAAFFAEPKSGAPTEVRSALAEALARIAARNLEVMAECQALRQSFERAGLPLLFLKGLTSGALAYRNPVTKTAIDIDLLIDPNDLRAAAGLLRECGYRLDVPRASPGNQVLQKWHRSSKESVWLNDARAIQLDLHTRVADNSRLIPRISVHSPRQVVDIGNGVQLPTLAPDELFAYLAVHGASSAWFRLKWISDFAGPLHGRNSAEVDRLYRRSQDLGAGRAAGQALLLADRLFGSLEANPELRRRLLDDPSTRRLCSIALRLLSRKPAEPTEQLLGTLPHRMSQFLLLPGIGFRLGELTDQVRRVFANRSA